MQAKIETSKTAAGNRRGVLLQRNSLDGSLTEAVTAFHAVATQHLLHLLKVEITGECAPLLDIVNDIPRLYRRTNKEKPARASAYVGRCVQQLAELIGLIGGGGDQQQQQWRTAWLADLLTELSGHYRNATLEVLTSVQRTEDSLKKLKKANQKAMAAATGATSRASSMSDDDKIRLQIYFDVQELGVE
ncbi:PREDICTED: conserved oligomeric Golgi complex subunit 2-like, partial [Rhagoletis zephyria]|uniref:conserved oligomeric Golgi complex subunit 2-like n=1 Tax=Rhagoletis zephyria TaxID=28612 RepID=UPI00081175AD